MKIPSVLCLLTLISCARDVKPPEPAPVVQVETPDPCVPLGSMHLPTWIRERGFVLTRLLKTCVTRQGKSGYLPESPWTAMGFPCHGGRGKIDINGNQFTPNMVSMLLATDCPMQAMRTVEPPLPNLSKTSKVLAYNPFAVQYWEVPGSTDADVGFTIDLRSSHALRTLWKTFPNQPIKVKLFGRENTWSVDSVFYAVDAQLVYQDNHSFHLEILDVHPLNESEVNLVKERCESLSPKRKCQNVF